jgi:hypothetical protein
MRKARESAVLLLLLASVWMVTPSGPVAEAQQEPLDAQLQALRDQFDTLLTGVGAPRDLTDRHLRVLEHAPSTGLARQVFMNNLRADLQPIVADPQTLQGCLDQVDAVVAQYVTLLEEAGLQ